MTYQSSKGSQKNREMVITDDWDLDAALQQYRHSLKITIQTYRQEDSTGKYRERASVSLHWLVAADFVLAAVKVMR